MTLKQRIQLYTFKDLQELLPEGLKANAKELKKKVEQSGIYRQLGGELFFTEADIAAFLDFLCAAPRSGGSARKGAGRLLSGGQPAPNETGYCSIIGEALNRDGFIYVGWAPADDTGLADLLTLVQHGYPAPLITLGIRAATPKQVDELHGLLADFRARPDSPHWYLNKGGVTSLLKEYTNKIELIGHDEFIEDNGGGTE